MASLCGFASRQAGVSDIMIARAENAEIQHIRVLLEEKNADIERLQDEVSSLQSERDQIIVSQQKNIEEIRSLEARIARTQEVAPRTTTFWEEKFLAEERARKAVESLRRSEEDKVLELQAQVAELKDQLRKQSHGFDPKVKQLVDQRRESSTSAINTHDSPTLVVQWWTMMKNGTELQLWQKDRFQSVFASLSTDYLELRFSTAAKKKPFEIGEPAITLPLS
jgi:predicted  nucleic acid-binding Zn-ribbon protein